jgi:hypothetical protein
MTNTSDKLSGGGGDVAPSPRSPASSEAGRKLKELQVCPSKTVSLQGCTPAPCARSRAGAGISFALAARARRRRIFGSPTRRSADGSLVRQEFNPLHGSLFRAMTPSCRAFLPSFLAFEMLELTAAVWGRSDCCLPSHRNRMEQRM